ncbi:hypothetical protein DW322_15210 [Rhodococcus rhodnii]|uniref:Uncharacterized protein n=2 Tax=Rhodococcus rhodnii TaxID=38312 RepID=R7WTF0_9NOCA|nr:hypothetical protein [Rhodococcus rhodnii]EOM78518.1 hypothetical protein Rrhod_0055 [Rhodococcus rhodnii LMG 5362]TXG91311.1 hypothetical protein DW322_15210 [Rhodococcus rhodnii]
MTTAPTQGRHRIGVAGTVSCREIPEIARALAALPRFWWAALRRPGRHSIAALGGSAVRPRTAPARPRWVTAPVG